MTFSLWVRGLPCFTGNFTMGIKAHVALGLYQACSKCCVHSPSALPTAQGRDWHQPILQMGKLTWETKLHSWSAAGFGLELMQRVSEATS